MKTCRRYGVACVIVASVLTASASAARGRGWASGDRVTPGSPVGLACPSAALCVAVDSSGFASISSAPAAGAGGWRPVDIDPGGSLSGVSCPTRGLCVAVDKAGNVLTSTEPAADAGWSAGVVDPGGLASVSCPTVSLCVAVGGPDVALSLDPAAGSPSWSVLRGVNQAVDYECGKYNPGGSCPPQPLTGVSCPSASVCVAVDGDGGVITSTNAASVTGWPARYGLESSLGTGNVACQSTGLCLDDCAVGEGAYPCDGADYGRSYGAGVVIAFDPANGGGVRFHTLSASALTGLWCQPSGCFAAAQAGGLLAPADPGDTQPWWQQLLPTRSRPATPSTTIAAVACPSQPQCFALGSDGVLFSGPPPVTLGRLRSALKTAVSLPPHRLAASGLIRTQGYRERFDALARGTLTISWYRRGSHELIARGHRTFQRPALATIDIKLTRRGRRLVSRRLLTVSVRGTFAPAGAAAVHATGHPLQTR